MLRDPRATIGSWAAELPAPATVERVRDDFWYVRIPGDARRWIPVEIEVGERTVKVTSLVVVPPEEDEAAFYRFMLRHNHAASPAAFAVAPDGVNELVGRIRVEELTVERLDEVVGRIVETTEITFRTLLRIGFASRFKG